MNKAQKEVMQSHLNEEKHALDLLKKVYERAIADCEKKILQLSSRTDLENLQSIIYQKKYQEAIIDQLEFALANIEDEEYKGITEYMEQCYRTGYTGVMYDLLASSGIPIIMPIAQEQIVKALKVDSKLSQGLYERLGEDVAYLKKSIRAELSRGIANGSSWNEMAGKVTKGMNSPFKRAYYNAVRITRTEGHRVQQSAIFDAQHRAKEQGADIVKQWDSTLDGRTRPSHKRLDGQIRELDEEFTVNGNGAQMPGHFGIPKEDIHCRCCLLQRAKWALDEEELDELKARAEYFGLDKSKDFEEFREKYVKLPAKADTMNVTTDVGKELQKIRDRLNGEHPSKDDLIEAGKLIKDCIGEYPMTDEEREYYKLRNKVMEMSNLIRAGKMKLGDEYSEVYRRWKEAEKKVNNLEETHAKWLSSKLAEIRQMGSDGLESNIRKHLSNSRSTVRKYIESAYSYYPRDWIEKSILHGNLTPKKAKRGYYSELLEEIAISGEGGSAFKTSVHELGHRFENVIAGLKEAEKEFYEYRTEGEELEWLGGRYRRDEKTRFDNFLDPYMGKDYKGNAYELVSMGFELAFTQPDKLAKDPEMEAWIYGLLSLL